MLVLLGIILISNRTLAVPNRCVLLEQLLIRPFSFPSFLFTISISSNIWVNAIINEKNEIHFILETFPRVSFESVVSLVDKSLYNPFS